MVPLTSSLVVDEERLRVLAVVVVCALSLCQCFDTVDWKDILSIKTCATYLWRLFARTDGQNSMNWLSRCTWKTAVKQR